MIVCNLNIVVWVALTTFLIACRIKMQAMSKISEGIFQMRLICFQDLPQALM